jgi:Papain family cysteine protease
MPSDRRFISGWRPEFGLHARARLHALGRPIQRAVQRDVPTLPPAFSLAQYLIWEFDQGQVGSCFANASTQAAQVDMQFVDPTRAFAASRALTWYEGRKADGLVGSGQDGGSVCSAMESLCGGANGTGAAHEALWPYQDNTKFLDRTPPATVISDANADELTQYGDVEYGDDWKASIYSGRPVAIGIWWPNAWMNGDSMGRVGAFESGDYGHAVLVMGWIDDWDGVPYWHIENSWGPVFSAPPAEITSQIPGYATCAPGKSYSFFAPTAGIEKVIAKGNAEMCSMAGPAGWTPRTPAAPIDPASIMPLSGSFV